MFPYRDLFLILGPYFSGSIFSVLWVTFDPTSCKYADHQNRWIAKDSPHVVLGPYFGCRQGSLFIKSWVPIRSLLLSPYFFHCRSILRSYSFFLLHWVEEFRDDCPAPWKNRLPRPAKSPMEIDKTHGALRGKTECRLHWYSFPLRLKIMPQRKKSKKIFSFEFVYRL